MRKEYDFSKAKRAGKVPHLKKHQAESGSKRRITIMLDNDLIDAFRELAEKKGMGYQTLINATLRDALSSKSLDEKTLRKVIREELKAR